MVKLLRSIHSTQTDGDVGPAQESGSCLPFKMHIENLATNYLLAWTDSLGTPRWSTAMKTTITMTIQPRAYDHARFQHPGPFLSAQLRR
jgi:hypothetical protein